MKSNKTPDFQKFLIRELRRTSYKWVPRNDALKLAKVSYGKYRCAKCEYTFAKKEIAIDHIDPVIDTNGFKDWNEFIDRLYCDVEGYQILCKACHTIKTNAENVQRRLSKKSE